MAGPLLPHAHCRLIAHMCNHSLLQPAHRLTCCLIIFLLKPPITRLNVPLINTWGAEALCAGPNPAVACGREVSAVGSSLEQGLQRDAGITAD